MTRRWCTATLAALVLAVSVVAATFVLRDMRGGADPRSAAMAAGRDFLDTYARPDGRVVRLDQGGDTVSEGQAYGMLVAVGIGDEARFRAIWTWTAANLQRDDDHLLAWRWADGTVADRSPAPDADLVAAGALALAGRRFADDTLLADAAAMGDAVLAGETVALGDRRVLVAGPWATSERIVNPSYFAVGMMSRLWWATGDHVWAPVADTARSLLDELTSTAPALVPDWASVSADGTSAQARPAPGGGTVQSGFEAGRAYVQLAVDCAASGQAIAARSWPFFAAQAKGPVHAAYLLDGEPASPATHPLALIAAAASAAAAGHPGDAARLLDRADDLDDRAPTYYGAASIAIARLWLDTDALGGCRPGSPTS